MADSVTYSDNAQGGTTAAITTSKPVTISWSGTASSYELQMSSDGGSSYSSVYTGSSSSASVTIQTGTSSLLWKLTGDGAALDVPLTLTATLASDIPDTPEPSEGEPYLNKSGLTHLWSKIKDKVDALTEYPVGYVYMSANSDFNPNGTFTGTWKLIDGYYLRTGEAMSDSGSNTHTMTVSEMPAHTHNVTETKFSDYSIRYSVWGSGTGSGTSTRTRTTSSTGSGKAFSIEPSSYNIKAWRRTQ